MINQNVKAQYIRTTKRLDCKFFLNENAINSRLIEENANKCTSLGKIAIVFNPPVFKRQFCKKTGNATIYCQSSDITNIIDGSDTYINKDQAIKVGAIVKKNQILVTGFGTIGNTRLISELGEGMAYANNVCRITVIDEQLYGYVFAFLNSKYGKSQINKNASGSVVRFIESPGIRKTLVPIFPKKLQIEIHNLIIESTSLRVEANSLIEQSLNKINKEFDSIGKSHFIYNVNIRYIYSGDKYTSEKRLEADFYKPQVESLRKKLLDRGGILLGDLSDEIFISNLRERKFVKKGIPLFTGQCLGLLRPDYSKQLSRKFTRNIEKNTTKNDDILISAFGTIGKVEFCYKNFYTGIFASQQVARIRVDKDKIHPGFVYLFLMSKAGQSQLLKYKTGSVIEWMNTNNFASIVIPIPEDKGKQLGEVAYNIMELRQKAYLLENQAINLVEHEIESWQK